jgi:hypothetical protein
MASATLDLGPVYFFSAILPPIRYFYDLANPKQSKTLCSRMQNTYSVLVLRNLPNTHHHRELNTRDAMV